MLSQALIRVSIMHLFADTQRRLEMKITLNFRLKNTQIVVRVL